jgi:hypothetical protein
MNTVSRRGGWAVNQRAKEREGELRRSGLGIQKECLGRTQPANEIGAQLHRVVIGIQKE